MVVAAIAASTIAVVGIWYFAPSRSYPTATKVLEGKDLKNKVAIVTGPTSGIGVETAKALAQAGAQVILIGRSEAKLKATEHQLLESVGETTKISTLVCDLNDLDSVQACAKKFLSLNLPLHILVNNAGIMALPSRNVTANGLEQQLGVCHVAHFYLTNLLLPALERGGDPEDPARVVCLSSSAFKRHDITKCLQSESLDTKPYKAWTAYGNAKASNLLFANELHRRYYASEHIATFSVMPGGIFTGLQGHISWKK